jgi:hypothetical protein
MPLLIDNLERGVASYWTEIRRRSSDVQRREDDFPQHAISFARRAPPHFDRADLADIMRWKHTDARWRDRALRGLADVSDNRIRPVTANVDLIEDAGEAFVSLRGFAHGIGVASISAILAAARPDRFPVIDVFALMALRKFDPEPWHATISMDKKTNRPIANDRVYPPFVDACRRIARGTLEESGDVRWTPRRVDMALWGIGKLLADRQI